MNHSDLPTLKLNTIAFILAGLAAFGIRFFLLGSQPLNDVESINALQALGSSHGGVHILGSEAAYTALTSIWFFLFGAGNFGARLLPALSGTALALSPILFRKEMGSRAVLLSCFLLALDAGWVAVSRQAFGMSWAGLFMILAIAALKAKKAALLGVFTALGLLGGPSIWHAAVGLGAAWLIYYFVFRPLPAKEEESAERQTIFSGIAWKTFTFWLVGTLIVSGTLLFLIPNGLNAAANGIVEYFSGWGASKETSVKRMLVGLMLSQPLGLLFGIIGSVRAFLKNSALDIFLTVWWLVSLVIVFVYPAREMVDLGWAVLPMLALAARTISSFINPAVENRQAAITEGLITIALMVSGWLIFTSFLRSGIAAKDFLQGVDPIFYLVVFILGVAFTFFAYWSQNSAGQGAFWGFLALLMVWASSAAWSGAGLGANPQAQLWARGPVMDEVDLLHTTVMDLSSWHAREPGHVNLIVSDVDSPGLRWALRDYTQVEFVTSTSPSSSPPMVVTNDQPSPMLAESYRGQDFVLKVKPAWEAMTLDQWLDWIAFDNAPLEKSRVVLWARADLFPDAEGFNP